MKKRFLSSLSLLVLATLLIPASCRNYEDRIPVTGEVMLDGEPLKNGFVAFIGSEGFAVASGPIQNGHYELSESGSRNGIDSGEYSVQFESWKEAPGSELPKGGFSKGVSAIPAKYQDSKTSGLTASVSEKSRKFNFELSSK